MAAHMVWDLPAIKRSLPARNKTKVTN